MANFQMTLIQTDKFPEGLDPEWDELHSLFCCVDQLPCAELINLVASDLEHAKQDAAGIGRYCSVICRSGQMGTGSCRTTRSSTA